MDDDCRNSAKRNTLRVRGPEEPIIKAVLSGASFKDLIMASSCPTLMKENSNDMAMSTVNGWAFGGN
jgi:hypothetical protein